MRRRVDVNLLILLSIFAYALTWAAGERGFFAFDQSAVFDGGYRILSGQVPYKDFVMPIGPLALCLQALFFRVCGVTYAAAIMGAAVCNVIATLLSVTLVRQLVPARRWLSYAAGLLTAIWFYPPFGILYIEQTAFLCSLAALVCLLAAIHTEDSRVAHRSAWLVVAGALAMLAVLSKQNVGGLFLPLYPLMLLAAEAPDWRAAARACALWCAGVLLVAGAFATWVLLASNMTNCLHYTLAVPSAYGWRERLLKRSAGKLLKVLVMGVGPAIVRPLVMLSGLAAGVMAWRVRHRDALQRARSTSRASCACS